jgi:hypothetical protein
MIGSSRTIGGRASGRLEREEVERAAVVRAAVVRAAVVRATTSCGSASGRGSNVRQYSVDPTTKRWSSDGGASGDRASQELRHKQARRARANKLILCGGVKQGASGFKVTWA